jgi:hypothetical protein
MVILNIRNSIFQLAYTSYAKFINNDVKTIAYEAVHFLYSNYLPFFFLRSAGKTEAEAKSACDCRLEKTMKKYPSVDEAMENMDKIATDPEIAACK